MEEPEDPFAMSAEQSSDTLRWLVRFQVGRHKCPVCGDNNWQVSQHFVSPVVVSPESGQVSLQGAVYPQILLTSAKCGYTMLFNAVMARALPKSEGNAAG